MDTPAEALQIDNNQIHNLIVWHYRLEMHIYCLVFFNGLQRNITITIITNADNLL